MVFAFAFLRASVVRITLSPYDASSFFQDASHPSSDAISGMLSVLGIENHILNVRTNHARIFRISTKAKERRKVMPVLLSVPESWFALQVAPRHEKKVAYMLEYKGHESFVPTSRVRRNWSDRVKSIDQPIFPGYVFCRIQKTGSGLVLATPGVVRVVSFGGKPSPVSNEEIEALQRISQAGGEVSSYPYTRIGQKVQITRGVFTGVIGVIVQVRNQHRLVVNVDTIMKAISITIDASDVAPVPGNSVALSQFAATA